jgi:hypothetical protein
VVHRSAFKNLASAIYFEENGAYFIMVINDKLLVFNDEFQHLSTHKGFESMILKGKYFVSHTDGNLTVCEIDRG